MVSDTQSEIIRSWNATEQGVPLDLSLDAMLMAQVRRTPDAVAASLGPRTLTYRELDRCANAVGHALAEMGVGPGDVVGLCLERSLEFLVGLVGIMKTGGAWLSLDPSYPLDRLRYMATDCGVSLVVTGDGMGEKLELDSSVRLYRPKRLSDPGAPEFGVETPPPHRPLSGEDLAYVLYTSGSTGRPKGAMVPQRAIVNHMLWMQAVYPVDERDVILQKTPASADAAVWELLLPLMTGARMELCQPGGHREPGYLVDLIAQRGVTVAQFVPTLLDIFVQHPRVARCGSLRRIFAGGEALTAAVVGRTLAALPVELVNLYGPTETAIDVSSWSCRRGVAAFGDIAPIGRPVWNTQFHVLNEAAEPVAIGDPGELYIGGRQVGLGYWNRPELTRERFVPDPFGNRPGGLLYRSGDRCRWRDDGTMEFLGRLDQQVKVRGFRIELGEIEALLGQHPGVGQTAVCPAKGADGTQALVAYLAPLPGVSGAELTSGGMRAYLAERIPEPMIPSAFVVLDRLPETPNGKIDRLALPPWEPYRADGHAPPDGSETDDAVVRTPTEVRLECLWRELLGVKSLRVADHFLDLGGHSILAMRLTVRILSEWGIELPVRSLFEHPTLRGMAALIDSLRNAPESVPAGVDWIQRLPRPGRMPLTREQERLWFVHRTHAKPETYHVPMVFRVQGAMCGARLERALRQVVRRHEILRMRVVEGEGRVWMEEVREDPFRSLVEMGERVPSEAGCSSVPTEWIRREVDRPLNPEEGWMWRCSCLRDGEHQHWVALVAHHLICDEWSCALWLREWGQAYAVEGETDESLWTKLTVQYADYAAWQRQRLEPGSPGVEKHRDYWRKELEEVAAPVALPWSRRGIGGGSGRGGQVDFRIGQDLRRAMERMAREEGATASMVALAAFQSALAAMSGGTDIVAGMPLSRRERPELEPLIGLFVNLVPIRLRLETGSTFREVVRRVGGAVLGAIEHGIVPFDEMIRVAGLAGRSGGAGLFDVVFVWKGSAGEGEGWEGLRVESVQVPSTTAKFPLTLFLGDDTSGGWLGTVEFDCDRFDRGDVERMIRLLDSYWNAAVQHPDTALIGLDWMQPWECRQLLDEFSGKEVSYPRSEDLVGIFEMQAVNRPASPAIRCGSETMTYDALNRRANRLARRLVDRGVQQGERVGVFQDRSTGFIVSVLGILKAGGAYVPLPPEYPGPRLNWMLQDAGIRWVVTDSGTVAPEGYVGGAHRVDLQLDGELMAGLDDRNLERTTTPTSPAYVMYTSGSTGKPKGVVVPHRAILRLVIGTDFLPWGPDQVFLLLAPTAFDASTLELWGPLLHGGCCAVYRDRTVEPVLLERELKEKGVTSLFLTTGLFHQIIDGEPGILRGVKNVVTGGDVLSADHAARALRALPGVRLVNGYGPTECTTFALTQEVTTGMALAPSGTVPIGRPIANTTAYILNAARKLVPVGVPGELYLGGDGLAIGYEGQSELTSERFVGDTVTGRVGQRLYRTGDLCRWLEDGTVEFLGRLDRQAKIRGFRVEPGEVEAMLRKIQGIRNADVWVGEGAMGKELVACVERQDGAEIDETSLRAVVQGHLPAHMVPSAWIVVDRFPLTANGKVDRAALRARLRPDESRTGVRMTPGNRREELLLEIWEGLLGRTGVGTRDNFFHLGGHSLMAMQLVFQVRRRMGSVISISDFLKEPTIEGMARRLEAAAGAQSEIRGCGDGPPLFFIPGVAGVNYLPTVLAQRVGDMTRFHDGLQYPGVDGESPPAESVKDLAVAMLAKVRAAWPDGKVCLAGYSLGGNVAHEMACLLEAEGQCPALVLLYDAAAPGSLRPRSLVSAFKAVARHFWEHGASSGFEVLRSRLLGKLRTRRENLAVELGVTSGNTAGGQSGGKPVIGVVTRQHVFDAAFRAAETYRPRRYGGNVVLMRSSDTLGYGLFRECDPYNGWRPYVGGTITVENIPGDHWAMLREPGASVLADATVRWMARCSAEGAR